MLTKTYENLGTLLLRLSFGGVMLLAHGLGKASSYPNPNFPDPIGLGADISLILAIFSEVICSFLLVLGLWTRLAAIPLIVTMLTAVFVVHSGDPFCETGAGSDVLSGLCCNFSTGSWQVFSGCKA